MLPSLFLSAASLALIAPASAGPIILARDDGNPSCEGVTETTTVTNIVTEIGAAAATGENSYSEHYSPMSASNAVASGTVGASPTQTSESSSPTGGYSNGTTGSGGNGGYFNTVYFTNWGIYKANFQPQDLAANQITHVLFSFATIAQDGSLSSSDSYADLEKHYSNDSWSNSGNNAYGCVNQLFQLKKANRGMKVLLSIGGWSYSEKFPPAVDTDEKRQRFASSAVELVRDWGLDGIDIDWEYPTNSAEANNFVQLLKACRTAFDNYAEKSAPGYHFLITVAASAGPTHYNTMDLPGMAPLVDMWNLMAYDYAGKWDSTSGHQANLFADTANPASTKFSTDKAIDDYIALGVPANKISLGLPLYGRSFEGTTGLGKPYSGIGGGPIEDGIWPYKDLPKAGAVEKYDDVAKASYSYDPATKELVSYDTVRSAKAKADYLLKKGLGGAVFWEASGDKKGDGSLVGTLANKMGNLDMTPNLLKYPDSKYDNIRSG